jgi:hypothetical protein
VAIKKLKRSATKAGQSIHFPMVDQEHATKDDLAIGTTTVRSSNKYPSIYLLERKRVVSGGQ